MELRLKTRTNASGKISPVIAVLISLLLAVMTWLSFPKALAEQEKVEIYSNEGVLGDAQALREEHTEVGRDEIRLSRPDEAAQRVANEQDGSNLVPGLDKLKVPLKRDALLVEKKTEELPEDSVLMSDEVPSETVGRAIASDTKKETKPTATKHISKVKLSNPLSSHPKETAVQEISLIASEEGFFPKQLFVNVNQPVKLYLASSMRNTSCLMLDRWGLKKGITPLKREEVTFVPDQVGTYRFYCPIGSIEGTLTVKEPVSSISRALSTLEETQFGGPIEPQSVTTEPKAKAVAEKNQLKAVIED